MGPLSLFYGIPLSRVSEVQFPTLRDHQPYQIKVPNFEGLK